MRLRYWGTRGSFPAPGSGTVRYGGNTPCVSVRADDDTLLIFDCGTGARALGIELAKSGPVRAHLFLSHTHMDHLMGLPFFVPAFVKGSELTIHGPAGIDRSLRDAIGGIMEYAYFPVPLTEVPARIDIIELTEETIQVGSATVRTQHLNHTAPCLGYRLSLDGAVLAYVTDHEPFATPTWRDETARRGLDAGGLLHAGDARHVSFLRNADLVIHDAQYTVGEYEAKHAWGHSPADYAVDVALAAGAHELALFHHDPTRTDDALDGLLAAARTRVSGSGRDLAVYAATEGVERALRGAAGLVTTDDALEAGAASFEPGARVLVAEDDDDVAELLRQVLVEDGCLVTRARDGREALRLARAEPFDLILLDRLMPQLDGSEVCRGLRADPALRRLPVLMLTVTSARADIAAGFADGASDYITKPFSVSQVRARVRSWLTRRGPA